MAWSTLWLIIQIAFKLFPRILRAIEDEKKKQLGRDEVVQAVLNRFQDVQDRAENARDSARADIDAGLRNDEFKRD